MKNRNLYFAMLLAIPFFVVSDNDVDVVEETQDSSEEEQVVVEEEVSASSSSIFESDDSVEEVVVTGSRIKRSTFDSIAPLQIITGDISREVGLIDPADILQDSTMATGQQIDSTFQGFVLDNGPGASTLSLRGLGSGRTLLLMNGRRIGPAGVEGAPTSPDLNLLPGSLIERYDILLDGASSVYGSDAVGGVTNVILRSDFDGFEAEIYAKESVHQPGMIDDTTFNITYGFNSDRWFVGMGYETSINPEVKLRDRPWTSDCEVDYEITSDGQIRTINQEVVVDYGFLPMDCKFTGYGGQVITPFLQSGGFGPTYLTYNEGYNLAGFPNWMIEEVGGVYPDFIGDGQPDSNFAEINTNGKDNFSSLSSELETQAFMAFGEYNFEGEGNHTFFFEANYGQRETYSIAGVYPVFPWVPATHPSNFCNPDSVNYVDCWASIEALHTDPDYVAQYNAVDQFGSTVGYDSGNRGFFNGWALGAGSAFFDPTQALTIGDAWGLYTGQGVGYVPTAHEYYCGVLNDANGNPGMSYVDFAYGEYFYDDHLAYPYDARGYNGDCFPTSNGGKTGSVDVQPYIGILGDRTETQTDVEQIRLVLGMKGDVTLDGYEDWSYEASAYRTESSGKSFRSGIRGDKLALSLGWDPSYGIPVNSNSIRNYALSAPCAVDEINDTSAVQADVLEGCIPFDVFSPTLYEGIVGDFGTQAEKDYLWAQSVFTTDFNQTVLSAYLTGYLGEVQGGTIGAVIGAEMREDEIISIPDVVRDAGLFFGFAPNGGALGTQNVNEGFVEVAVPLLAGLKYAQELNIEASLRYSDIETKNGYTGATQKSSGSTHSIKIGYRPINDLLIRATKGTSYRAPNLREVALRAESGFVSVGDPCRVPSSYITGGEYDASLEQREQVVLDNCVAAGVDPTTLGYDFDAGTSIPTSSTEVITAGTTTLEAEESTSTTFGFVYDIPNGHTVGASWYDIVVENAIIEPSASYVVYDCYYENPGYTSQFCDNVVRDATTGEFDYIAGGFTNRDKETARGIDINYRASRSFEIGDRLINAGMDITANKMLERTLSLTNNVGEIETERYEGEPGYPEWTAFIRNYVSFGDWNATWQVSFKSRVDQDADSVDAWGSALGVPDLTAEPTENELTGELTYPNAYADTCYGIENGDVDCRDVGFIKSHVTHNMSLYYRADTYVVGFGVRNVFDKAPPRVDGTEISSYSNVPIGYGYSIFGREYFLNISKSF